MMTTEKKPTYRYWPGVGMVRCGNARPACPHHWQASTFDARYQDCAYCGEKRRTPADAKAE